MDNSSQTLELQIKSKSQEAMASVDKLINKLTGIEKTVSSIDDTLKKKIHNLEKIYEDEMQKNYIVGCNN